MTAAYTLKETEIMREMYLAEPQYSTVISIATKLRKRPRSVVAKLSKEGIYTKSGYVDKLGRPPITKVRLVHSIETALGLKLPDLDKCPKETLRLLEKAIVEIDKDLEACLSALASTKENYDIAQEMLNTILVDKPHRDRTYLTTGKVAHEGEI